MSDSSPPFLFIAPRFSFLPTLSHPDPFSPLTSIPFSSPSPLTMYHYGPLYRCISKHDLHSRMGTFLVSSILQGNVVCVCIIRGKYLSECCCMWSNRLCQSTSMSTVAPVSRGAGRKWTAVGPLRVTRSTSTPAIWRRQV